MLSYLPTCLLLAYVWSLRLVEKKSLPSYLVRLREWPWEIHTLPFFSSTPNKIKPTSSPPEIRVRASHDANANFCSSVGRTAISQHCWVTSTHASRKFDLSKIIPGMLSWIKNCYKIGSCLGWCSIGMERSAGWEVQERPPRLSIFVSSYRARILMFRHSSKEVVITVKTKKKRLPFPPLRRTQ